MLAVSRANPAPAELIRGLATQLLHLVLTIKIHETSIAPQKVVATAAVPLGGTRQALEASQAVRPADVHRQARAARPQAPARFPVSTRSAPGPNGRVGVGGRAIGSCEGSTFRLNSERKTAFMHGAIVILLMILAGVVVAAINPQYQFEAQQTDNVPVLHLEYGGVDPTRPRAEVRMTES